MKQYEDMSFEELLAYKEKLINNEIWITIDADEKREINSLLEKKYSLKIIRADK